MGVIGYWRRIVRFALLGRLPEAPDDVSIWALCVPYRLWRAPRRYDGTTFEDAYTRGAGRSRAFVPYRGLYLVFLFLWPFVAWLRALWRRTEAPRYWRLFLARPDLSLLHPKSDYTEAEAAWSRPDFALGMYAAWDYSKTRADWHSLEDKGVFVKRAREAGLPIPPTVTSAEAIARGGQWICKDPTADLGYGVAWLTAEELAEVDDHHEIVVQERLYNHPALPFPKDAPLSTLRVITLLDANGEPTVSRCAVRIGRSGSPVDNTQQGGIWCRVDLETGELCAGVKKDDFGVWEDGHPIRHGEHPDNGRSFVGVRVPWFDEGRRLALEAHRKLAPDAPSLGWDVALAAEAPVLLEVNVWTVCYDYDPQTDAFTPSIDLILRRLRGGEA